MELGERSVGDCKGGGVGWRNGRESSAECEDKIERTYGL